MKAFAKEVFASFEVLMYTKCLDRLSDMQVPFLVDPVYSATNALKLFLTAVKVSWKNV